MGIKVGDFIGSVIILGQTVGKVAPNSNKHVQIDSSIIQLDPTPRTHVFRRGT
jgi:hypothetical protein